MKLMALFSVFILMGLTTSSQAKSKSETDSLKQLLIDSDYSRGGGILGITWDLKVINVEQGKEKNPIALKVEGATQDDAILGLITFLGPDKYRGQKLLIRDYNLWFGKPGLRRPVPISGRQRLSGSASNADVAASNYAHDYHVKSLGMDSLDGVLCHQLELKAREKLVTYSKIKYWVDTENHLGRKAEFFGVSGKLIKSAIFEYENQVEKKGKPIPFVSRIVISDAIRRSDETRLEISKVRLEAHSMAKFQQRSIVE
jgi:hypothetical protein